MPRHFDDDYDDNDDDIDDSDDGGDDEDEDLPDWYFDADLWDDFAEGAEWEFEVWEIGIDYGEDT